MPTRHDVSRRRGVLYVLAVVALVVGVTGLALGVLVQRAPVSAEAQPLAVGQPYTVPERVPFVGDLVVYGTPAEGGRPQLDELGCVVTEGGGPLSTDAATREDRIVLDGTGLVPLVSFPGLAGYSVACNGPAAEAAAPLYVVEGASPRSLVPLGGYSVAALLLPLGALGLVMLRASRA